MLYYWFQPRERRHERNLFDTDAIDGASASEVIHFRTERELESGELEVGYDEDEVPGDEDSLTLHRYDPAYQTFVAVDSIVDTDEKVVRAEIDEGGRYAVFDPDRWEHELRSTPPVPLDEDESPLTTTPDAEQLVSLQNR